MSGSNLVKISIKAPNQLVDDQTVHCERSWTVRRLKHHLASVYPCKPHPDGQKLIYSGQLLSDEAVLSEVLRSYDGQENNTIHLENDPSVYAFFSSIRTHPDGQKLIYSGQLLSDEAVLSEVLRSYDGQENNTIHLVCSVREAHSMNRQASASGQRPSSQRATPFQAFRIQESNNNWNDGRRSGGGEGEGLRGGGGGDGGYGFPNSSLPGAPPTVQPSNPQDWLQQSLWLQQAYLNYMAHYSQMYMMANRVDPSNMAYPTASAPGNLSQPSQESPPNDPREIPRPPDLDRNENEVDEPAGGAEEEGRPHRDWLEWFYMGSRFMVLFTLVYFYSSPERFIMVVAMALILINIDVFRWRRVQEQQPLGVNIPNNGPAGGAANLGDANPATPMMHPTTPQPDNSIVPMNWLHITWSFMKTFFLSLVPDNRDI